MYDISYPDALLQKDEANQTFDQICGMYQSKDPDHMKVRKIAEKICQRNRNPQHEYTVEKEGDNGLSSRPECKVASVQEGVLRHDDGLYGDEQRRDLPGLIIGVVKLREKMCRTEHDTSHDDGADGECSHAGR